MLAEGRDRHEFVSGRDDAALGARAGHLTWHIFRGVFACRHGHPPVDSAGGADMPIRPQNACASRSRLGELRPASMSAAYAASIVRISQLLVGLFDDMDSLCSARYALVHKLNVVPLLDWRLPPHCGLWSATVTQLRFLSLARCCQDMYSAPSSIDLSFYLNPRRSKLCIF